MWLLAVLLLADTAHAFPLTLSPAESVQVTLAGAGDPVVLLPGLFGSAFGYRNLVPRLTEAGHRAIVVAHSLGASMAYRLAYRRPDLVRGIVSLEGGPAEAATTRGFRRAMQLAPWIKLLGGVRLVRTKIHRHLIAASGDTTWASDEVVDGYTAGAARDFDATLKAYLAMAGRREPERLGPHLAEIRCPVRLVVGAAAHEGGVSAAEVVVLGQAIATFNVDTVPGAGHFLYEEQPAAVLEAVARLWSATAPRPEGSGR